MNEETNDTIHQIALNQSLSRERERLMKVILFLMIIISSLAITLIVTLNKWEPQVRFVAITEDPTLGMQVSVLSNPLPFEQSSALIRKHLRDYVLKRHKVDHLTEVSRFPWVARSSTTDVGKAFEEEYEANKEGFKHLNRDIEIMEDTELPSLDPDRKMRRFIFKTYDWLAKSPVRTPDNVKSIKTWNLTLEYLVNATYVTDDIALENPMGVFVTAYYREERKNNYGGISQ